MMAKFYSAVPVVSNKRKNSIKYKKKIPLFIVPESISADNPSKITMFQEVFRVQY